MIGLIIAAAVIIIILFLRIGVTVEFSDDGLFVTAQAAFVKISVYPKKQKRQKPEKVRGEKRKKEKKRREEKPEAKKPGLALDFERLLKEALRVMGKVRRRLLIKELTVLHIRAGGDPYVMAMDHGKELAALGLSQAALESLFRVRHYSLHTSVDFVDERARVYVFAALSIAVWEALSIGFSGLMLFLRSRKPKAAESRKSKEKKKKAENQ